MGPVESVTTCMAKYFYFSGRASRSEYWWFVLFVFVGSLSLEFIEISMFGAEFGLLVNSFDLAMIVPLLAADWRRLHDSGRPGWYNLLFLFVIPITLLALGVTGQLQALKDPTPGYPAALVVVMVCGGIFLLKLWWMTRPSDIGANRYGAPGD